jgi:hypothetical protein
VETPTRSATEDSISEHIPWQHLSMPPRPSGGRILLALAVAIGLTALGVVVGRAMAVPTATVSPAASPVPAAEPSPVTIAPALVAPAPDPSPPLREADLLAAPPVAPELVVVGRAQWFIAEYLTRLGEEDQAERVRMAAGWNELPGALVDSDPGPGASYVEWVVALGSRLVSPGTHEVSLAVGRLVAPDLGEPYARVAPEGWQVLVTIDPSGSSAVAGWPLLVELPGGAGGQPPGGPADTFTDSAGAIFLVGGDQAP